MRIKMMQRVLEKLQNSSDFIEASALISSDGLVICAILPDEIEDDRIGAMAASLGSLAIRASEELGCGISSQVLLQGSDGIFLTQTVGHDALLAILISSEGSTGRVLVEVRQVINTLYTLLRQQYDDFT